MAALVSRRIHALNISGPFSLSPAFALCAEIHNATPRGCATVLSGPEPLSKETGLPSPPLPFTLK